MLTFLNNNGFTVGNDDDVNASDDKYIHMGWKAPLQGASGLTLDSYKINTTSKFKFINTQEMALGVLILHMVLILVCLLKN